MTFTFEALQEAWEHRMLALQLENEQGGVRHVDRQAHTEHMRHWTRAVSSVPGRGKLRWLPVEGKPPYSRAKHCLVLNIFLLEWHP